MKPLSFIGAAVGGVIGALIWAGIVLATDYEVGYVAWAIGGLVGFGSVLLGGFGQTNGVVCGVIALLSILGGKYMAAQSAVGEYVSEEVNNLYLELMKDAEDLAELESEESYAKFMVTHKYTPNKRAADVTEEEIADFTENTVPMLEELAEKKPSSEEWAASEKGRTYRERIEQQVDVIKVVEKGLGPIDIIFAVLGIGTAFSIVSRRKEQVAE